MLFGIRCVILHLYYYEVNLQSLFRFLEICQMLKKDMFWYTDDSKFY